VTTKDIAAKNPLALAFVGDAYWTLYIRRMLISKSNGKANALHQAANRYVCATAQSGFYHKIAPFFTEVEANIAGRARNSECNTRPKNCTLAEYKLATAFEAVVGYNLLIGNKKRLNNLFKLVLVEVD
jgi:ribonuclease-3 family protein